MGSDQATGLDCAISIVSTILLICFDYVCELVTGLVLELPPHRFDRIKPQYV